MEGQREKLNGNRRRRRRNKSESKTQTAPILIAARRPDSPRLGKISRRNIAASARPKRSSSRTDDPSLTLSDESDDSETNDSVAAGDGAANDLNGHASSSANGSSANGSSANGSSANGSSANGSSANGAANGAPRRVARIAQAPTAPSIADESAGRRERLLDRLISCEGRGAISRIASELYDSGGIPEEQPYQLQLLEHVDERRASEALDVLCRLLERQVPIKRPILDQRLRRLEEEAEESSVRDRARELRRRLRSAAASNERV